MVYGVRKPKNRLLMIGDTRISFQNHNVQISDKRYLVSSGKIRTFV